MDRLTSVSNTAPSGQQQSMNSQIAAALGISEESVHVQDMQSLNATPDMQSIPGLQMLRAAGLQPTTASPLTVQSSIPMTVTYGDNGNILSKTGIGTYSYQSQKPHAVTGVENTSSLISTATQQATYNGFGKVESITDNGYRMDFTYGPDNERWKTELYKNNVLRRTTVYAGDYEEVTTGSTSFGYCYLGDGVIALTVDGGTPYIGYAYTDNLGSILTAVSTDGTVVYNADYDAWGRQNVTSDYVGYHRGYCGHEMMPEFGLINMNGRLYDPVLGRFLSPDNFVQMPDNSQSFNRYSYCLNNPLKYTDPSGELFGIDDAVLAFAVFNAASSMMQAAYNGQSVWKAGALSLLSSAASYGIGSAFGAVGGFGKEMLRAGAHGLAGGAISALGGGSFWSGFSSSALASGIGSFAQGVHMNQALMVASTTAMGGLGAWATGGDWVEGAMQGLNIGLLNHAKHGDENGVTPVDVKVVTNKSGCYEFIVTGTRQSEITSPIAGAAGIRTALHSIGSSLNRHGGNSSYGNNHKFYWHTSSERGFYGNKYVRTAKLATIGKNITKITGPIGIIKDIHAVGIGAYDDYIYYKNTSSLDGYNTVRASADAFGGWVGAWAGLKAGGFIGGCVGSVPGAVIGGIVGGFGGAFGGSIVGTLSVDKIYGR